MGVTGDYIIPRHLDLCKDHKNVAKAKIKKYRAERREGKVTQATGAKPAAAEKVKEVAAAVARARKLQGGAP